MKQVLKNTLRFKRLLLDLKETFIKKNKIDNLEDFSWAYEEIVIFQESLHIKIDKNLNNINLIIIYKH